MNRLLPAIGLAIALCFLSGAPVAVAQDAGTVGLEREVEANPDRADLRIRLGIAYEARDRIDDAIAQFQAAFDLARPGSEEREDALRRLRYAIATRNARRGEVDVAREQFEALAEDYPDNALIVYSAAVANLLVNRMDVARNGFERVIEIDPGFVNAYLNLATIDESEGRLEAAVGNLERIIEIDADSVAAQRARVRLDLMEGQLLARQGNHPEAVAALERVLEAEPSNRIALNTLASIHREQRDVDAETVVQSRILESYPDDAGARMRLAELYLISGDFALAWDQLDRVVASDADSRIREQARRIIARLRQTEEGRAIDAGRMQARIEEYRARLRAEPDDAAAWKELGLLYFRENAYEDAVAAFENVLRIDPDDRRATEGLAMLYDHLGRFEDSAREYARLVELETDEVAAARHARSLRLVTAKDLYARGRHAEAAGELQAVLDEEPDNQIAWFYIALIHAEEEDLPRAVDAYREVVRIVPSHVGARMNLAFSYELLNREEDAIDEYRKILQSNPSPAIEERVRRRLDLVQRRIRGVTVTGSYVMAYDSNSNLSERNVIEDYRSDLSLNLAYQHKAQNDLRWRFLLSPSYINYHKGQFDYLGTAMTVSATLMPGRYTLVGGYSWRSNASLIADTRLSRMHTVFADALLRTRLPNLLRPFSDDRASSNLAANLSYSDFEARNSPFFSSYTASAGISLNQLVSDRARFRLGYSAVSNSNKELVGNDYAYLSHGVTIGADRQTGWGSINANYGYTLLDYSNPDSFTQFTRKRRNNRHNLAVGANFRFRQNIGFFTTLSWTRNSSNLPVGFILGREDIIEGLQSSSLSNYERFMISGGMNVTF